MDKSKYFIFILSFFKINCGNNCSSNGTFKADQENYTLKIIANMQQMHRNQRHIRPTVAQMHQQSLQKTLILQQMSNQEFVQRYNYYKDCAGVEEKIKEVIAENNNCLIRELAKHLNDKHLLLFYGDLKGHILTIDYEDLEPRFYRLCSNISLLNKFSKEKQKSILEFKKIIELTYKFKNLSKISTNFNLDFYDLQILRLHEEVLKAAQEIRSDEKLAEYANNPHNATASTILTAADRIEHGRNWQPLKYIVDKENLTIQEEDTLLKRYSYCKSCFNYRDIRNIHRPFYNKLEKKAQQISYDRYFISLNTTNFTDEQKRVYLHTRDKFNKWTLAKDLILSPEEFDYIYSLTNKKDLDINSLSEKEQSQLFYVLNLKNFNATTLGFISQNKTELALQTLNAGECFYNFACGMADESLTQIGNYIMSQPVRCLILAGGCALAPVGAPAVTAYYLTLYAYTVYSSYGILKEDINRAISAYQNDDYYDLGKVAVRTATDAVILKNIGKTIRSGYKFAKIKAGKNQAKRVEQAIEAGLSTGQKVQVYEKKISKLDQAIDKITSSSKIKPKNKTKVQSNISLQRDCDTCPMRNVNPNKDHYVQYKDLILCQKYKKQLDNYLNNVIKKNPPSDKRIGTLFKVKRHEHVLSLENSCEINKETGLRSVKAVGGHVLTDALQKNPNVKLEVTENFNGGGFKANIHYKGAKSEKPKSFFPKGTTAEQAIDWMIMALSDPLKVEEIHRGKLRVVGKVNSKGVRKIKVIIINSKKSKGIESWYPVYKDED